MFGKDQVVFGWDRWGLAKRLMPARHDSKKTRTGFLGGPLGKNSKRAGAAALTGVPRVVTGGPRRWAFEGVHQVEDGPGQHHDVVDVQVGHNHLRCHSDPCRKRSHTYFRIYSFLFPENMHWRKSFSAGDNPGTWGRSSSRPSPHPRWCTGPKPSPGRTQEYHRRRGKQNKGWGRHLQSSKTTKSHALEGNLLGQRTSS